MAEKRAAGRRGGGGAGDRSPARRTRTPATAPAAPKSTPGSRRRPPPPKLRPAGRPRAAHGSAQTPLGSFGADKCSFLLNRSSTRRTRRHRRRPQQPHTRRGGAVGRASTADHRRESPRRVSAAAAAHRRRHYAPRGPSRPVPTAKSWKIAVVAPSSHPLACSADISSEIVASAAVLFATAAAGCGCCDCGPSRRPAAASSRWRNGPGSTYPPSA